MSIRILPALLIVAALPAAEVFRDDFDRIEAWKPQMSWLSNPTAVAETTAPAAGQIRLRVPERRRGMKWNRDCAFAITPAANILTLRYRAEHLQADTEPVVQLAAGTDSLKPIALSQLAADGQWHTATATIALAPGQTRLEIQGITLQVQADDGGSGVIEVDWLVVSDAEPK